MVLGECFQTHFGHLLPDARTVRKRLTASDRNIGGSIMASATPVRPVSRSSSPGHTPAPSRSGTSHRRSPRLNRPTTGYPHARKPGRPRVQIPAPFAATRRWSRSPSRGCDHGQRGPPEARTPRLSLPAWPIRRQPSGGVGESSGCDFPITIAIGARERAHLSELQHQPHLMSSIRRLLPISDFFPKNRDQRLEKYDACISDYVDQVLLAGFRLKRLPRA